ncbi:MAG: HAD hydrolase family protein [Clostridia bacterium]|nr:HAD hydrolase family protein [Clostridia bacterium]
MKGAVFFDYDGTLTDGPEGVNETTEATRRAVARLRENGYLAVLDTGRAMCYADHSGVEFDGMITSNGTHAMVRGEVVLDQPIDGEALGRLMARLDGMGIYYGIDNPEKCYARDLNEATFIRWLRTFSISPAVFRPLPPDGRPIGYKLSVLYHTMDEVERLRAEFGGLFSFDCHNGYPCVDVTARTASKGRGVQAVIGRFGLPLENTYAFGDGANDIDMLRSVGHAVAMGRHAQELDAICEFVTKRVRDEGIEFGLKRYGLI